MQTYTVQSGDTLGKIAKRFYSDAAKYPLIVAANAIADPDQLLVGQSLVIPDAAVAAAGVNAGAPPANLGSKRALSEQRLAKLHPGLASRGRAMLDACAQSGLAIMVTEGLRTWEGQDALYAKGRTVPPIGKKYFVDRGARDPAGVFSPLIDRRLLPRGGKEAAPMLKVVGGEAVEDEADGRFLLHEIAREGARRMLVAALEAEVAAYLEAHRDERDAAGHALVVRNGKGRTRKVTVGSGTIPVSAPRVNDRRTGQDGERRRFTSRILPPYMRRSPKVAEVLPVLYLRGLSTGDFREALAALLGDDAAGLSATNIARLTNEWEGEYRAFQKRSLADRDYVYVWVDGVHFNVRLEDDRLCTLVMIGVRPDGPKEVITVEDGYRESAESWKTVLRDLKRRGMRPPVVAVGDGALGFWAAVQDVWPKTLEQRDWFHKLGNILDKLPRRLQPREGRAPRGDVRRDPRSGTRRDATVRYRVRGQVPQGGHDPGEGHRRAAHVLRLPRRALEASAHVERDRVAVRDGAAAPARDEGRGVAHEGPPDGLQAPRHGTGLGGVASTARISCRSSGQASASWMASSRKERSRS